MESSFIIYVELSDEEKEIELNISYDIVNDGIGPYEYWGMRGIDRGTNQAEINEITYDGEYSVEDRKKIDDHINKKIDEICAYCLEDYGDRKADVDVDEADSYRKYGDL